MTRCGRKQNIKDKLIPGRSSLSEIGTHVNAKLSRLITDLIAQEERMTHGIVATNYRPQ
jgi:hypothetical protein